MTEAHEILTKYKTFAVVGVSQNKEKYGYEVFETLLSAGYKVYPINPKYEVVDDYRCYPSLKDLPEKPEVVVTLVPPPLTEKVVEACAQLEIPVVWMPPGFLVGFSPKQVPREPYPGYPRCLPRVRSEIAASR